MRESGKRRWISFLCVMSWLVLSSGPATARLFFTGPNPFLSCASFPQDGLRIRGPGSLLVIDRHPRGWFGNLDDPAELPSASYTMTNQTLHLSNPSSEFHLGGSWTQTNAALIPYYFQSGSLHFQTLASAQVEELSMDAHGVARSYEDTVGWELIPFEAELKRRNRRYGVGGAVAGLVGSTPVGFRLTADYRRTGEPFGYLAKMVEGVEETTGRYTWGWTTQQSCNHILASHANIDAWHQDRYSMARSWLVNGVLGATIDEHKVAVRYRHFVENAEGYEYDAVSDAYLRDGDWIERTSRHLIRGYGLYNLGQIGGTDFSLLGFAETHRAWTNWVGEGDQSRLDCAYEKKTDFEIVPIVSSSIGSGFVRGGFDILWGWASLSNTDVWGRQRVYRPSYPYAGWTPDWEEPSYSNSFFAANLIEIDMEYPILKSPDVKLRLEVWRMYQLTWMTSHYGENENRDGIYVFDESALRNDRREETWTSGLLGVWVRFQSLFGGLMIDLPVTYHSLLDTEVVNADGSVVFSDHQTASPAVQDPPRLRFILGRSW